MPKNKDLIIDLTDEQQDDRKNHFNELITLMPYDDKIWWAKQKIKEFLDWCQKLNHEEVLISFSGGKDSTVLMDLVVKVHLEMQSSIYLVPVYAVEITFPSTIKFIKMTVKKYQKINTYLKNPLFKKPTMSWDQILKQKGYPIFSKQVSVMINRIKRSKTKNLLTRICFGIEHSARYHLSYKRLFLLDDQMTCFRDENGKLIKYFFSEKCCDYVKGGLKHEKRPSFTGTLANESLFRKQSWIKNGCNIYKEKHPMSRPLSLWNNENVWKYIHDNKLVINDAYNYDLKMHNINNLRFTRLGCTACPMGSQIEEIVAKKYSKDNQLSKESRYWNRFEKLLDYMPNLYYSQIWKTGMYHILADMDIKIRNDLKYMEYYNQRRKEIDIWYENIGINLLRIMVQIELNNSNTTHWKYSISDFNKALTFFKINHKTNKKEIESIRESEKSNKKWKKVKKYFHPPPI